MAIVQELRDAARGSTKTRAPSKSCASASCMPRSDPRRAIAASLSEGQRAAQTLLLAGLLVLAGALLVAGIMISQRFVAQNEKLQQTLRESEAQLRHLIESAPLPLLILRGVDQQLLYGNERALQQFALNIDSLQGRTLAEFHVDPEARLALPEALSRQGSVRDYEIHLKDTNGRQFWLLMSAQPIRYAGVTCLLTALANPTTASACRRTCGARRCTTSSPGCPTAPCSWRPSTTRCARRAGARDASRCSSSTSTASRK